MLVLKNIKSKFRVTDDSNNDGIFTFHKPISQDVHFNMHNYRLRYHYTKNCHITLVQTVSRNEAGYIKLQLNSAKLEMEIYAKVGHPYQKYFKKLIKFNLISN